MITIPAGHLTDMVGKYIEERTHSAPLVPGQYQAFAFVDDNKDFQGGVVVSNFKGTDCEILVAAETPMAFRPHMFRAVFQYIFVQLGCVRCTCITTKGNAKARRFIEGSGFVLEGRLRRGFDGVKDALIYGLLADECRFLGGFDGEEGRGQSSTSAGPGSDGERTGSDEQGDCGSAGEP